MLEGEAIEVCLSPLAQELEATITVALYSVAGSATEGMLSVCSRFFQDAQYFEINTLKIYYRTLILYLH